jgi:hypothetical protein
MIVILLYDKSIYYVLCALAKAGLNFVIELCGYDILHILMAYFSIGSYLRGPG